jgi:hypothetical protein
MKTLISCVCSLSLLFALSANNANSQEKSPKEEHQFVVMPRDLGLPLILVQPESPLEFLETQLLVNVSSGHWIPSFRIRNCGTKPIRAFTIAFAGSGERGWKADAPQQDLMPGKAMALAEDSKDEIVPLTEALRDRLNLRGPMQGIVVLLVVDVEYEDGSHFQESGYEALGDYLHTVRGLLMDPRFKRPASYSPRKP